MADAAGRKLEHEEEEEASSLHADPSGPFEYKIIRSASGAFKNAQKFRRILERESRAGWELLEKFDDGRARLKRPITCRERDHELKQDPYRTHIGAGELTVVILVLAVMISVIGGVFAILTLLLK